MPALGTDVFVSMRDDPIVRQKVEDIFSAAKRIELSTPVGSSSDNVVSFGSFDFVDVGKVECGYAVAGAWNVAAKCEISSKSGGEAGWLGWVFDYVPRGKEDSGSEVPAKFSFCFDRSLVESGKVVVKDSDLSKRVEEALSSSGGRYVCVEGWVDNPDYFLARSGKKRAEIAKDLDKAFSEVGLYHVR